MTRKKEQSCFKCGYMTGDTRTSYCPECGLPFNCDYPDCEKCRFKKVCERAGAKIYKD